MRPPSLEWRLIASETYISTVGLSTVGHSPGDNRIDGFKVSSHFEIVKPEKHDFDQQARIY